jgi:hypothetical protein
MSEGYRRRLPQGARLVILRRTVSARLPGTDTIPPSATCMPPSKGRDNGKIAWGFVRVLQR